MVPKTSQPKSKFEKLLKPSNHEIKEQIVET